MLNIEFTQIGDSLGGSYSIPEMGLFDEPLREVSLSDSTLQFRLLYGLFQTAVHTDVEEITGSNPNWGPPVRIHLKRSSLPQIKSYSCREVSFANGAVRLSGTLFLPTGTGPFPAVVLIPGSGSQGRAMWEYRSHGYALAARGIAALAYDKRGVGASSGVLANATFTDLAGDALAAVELLRQQPEIESRRVGLYGISQGGWISAIASRRDTDLAFIVMLEGPAVSLEEQECDRVEYSLRADGFSTDAIDSAVAHTRLYFDAVNTGKGWKELSASVAAAHGRPWSEYVNLPEVLDDSDMLWWRRNAYDPAEDLQKVTCPVLAIFGELDVNVPPQENRTLMERYLAKAGVDFETAVIPGLGHSVTTNQTLRGGEWDWPGGYWVWCKRPRQLDEVPSQWIMEHSSAH